MTKREIYIKEEEKKKRGEESREKYLHLAAPFLSHPIACFRSLFSPQLQPLNY